jgi:hypothetical protein
VQRPAAMGSVGKSVSRRSSAQMLHVIRGDAGAEEEAIGVAGAGCITDGVSVVSCCGGGCGPGGAGGGARGWRIGGIVCGLWFWLSNLPGIGRCVSSTSSPTLSPGVVAGGCNS